VKDILSVGLIQEEFLVHQELNDFVEGHLCPSTYLLGLINIIPTDLADNRRSDGINLIYGGLKKWRKQLFLVQLDRKIIIK